VGLEQVFVRVFRFSPLSIIAPRTLYVLANGIVVKQSISRTEANPRPTEGDFATLIAIDLAVQRTEHRLLIVEPAYFGSILHAKSRQ